MSNARVYTRDGSPSGLTPASGSKVFIGDTEVQGVMGLKLVAEPSGVWTLQINLHVDPQKLFAALPSVEGEIETTCLASDSRQFIAGR